MKRLLATAWRVLLEMLALGMIVVLIVLTTASRGGETAPMKQKPTLGRVVLYSFLDKQGKIVERPATVVAVWPENTHGVNLHVLLDGTNDRELAGVTEDSVGNRSYWATSIAVADDPAVPQAGRWRWPPRE